MMPPLIETQPPSLSPPRLLDWCIPAAGPDTPGRSEQRPGLTSDADLGALVFVEPVARVVLAVSRIAAR